VIGPSGSGKSSLVTAGVLPKLARGVSGLGPCVVRALRPGEHPAALLAEAVEVPQGGALGVPDRVAALLAHRGAGAWLLMVVDQLEELFTLASAGERTAFSPRCVRCAPSSAARWCSRCGRTSWAR
jgi:eukaryotic-like serine/threonine-protein kinase